MDTSEDLTGIFLHYEGEVYAKVEDFLEHWQPTPYWGKIRAMQANFRIVSSLVPMQLQQGAESWLILHRRDFPQELLIVPFPEAETEVASTLNNIERFRDYLLALLEYISGYQRQYGDRQQWYPYNGFRNLIDLAQKQKPRSREQIFRARVPRVPAPSRFEVVRLDKSLESILQQSQLPPGQEESESNEIGAVFTQVNQHAQERRDELLTLVLTANDEESKRQAIEGFEKFLLDESSQLTELVLTRRTQEKVVPNIVDTFDGVIDEETKKFLISSATVARFADKQLAIDFDYSLAGCGLWKAVERELNLSFIWHLRRYYHIVGDEPFVRILEASFSLRAGKETVDLSETERQGSDQLKGIELGNIEYLLRSADPRAVQPIQLALTEGLSTFVLGDENTALRSQIGRIKSIRNKFAHIKAMPYSEYQQLHSLVLSNKKQTESLLAKILQMKKEIMYYWKQLKLIA